MHAALFVPCYIDQFYPQVAFATIDVLGQHGVEVEFPAAQTCCGQPMANIGCSDDARPLAQRFLEIFQPYTHVVCPSGSCVAMIRHHYDGLLDESSELADLKEKTFELCEFLTDVLEIEGISGSFPHRVGLHQSCHGLRELRLGSCTERMDSTDNKIHRLLESLEGIQLTELRRQDECCGFGGTFAVSEEAVSTMMGLDRLHDHQEAGTEILTAADMSCLMHLDGLIQRQRFPMRVMHVAEILAGRPGSVPATEGGR